jgi:hypothetical protein
MPFFAACFSYQPPSPPPSQLVLWHQHKILFL